MAAMVKYVDSDSTKDPLSDEEKTGKGKKNGNGKGYQHNPTNQGGNKRKDDEWLTPMHRATTNDARVGNPLGQAGQVPPSSNY